MTNRKKALQHLGIKPGEKIELQLLPDGRAELKATRTGGTIDSFLGLLAGKSTNVARIEEFDEALAAGRSGKV